MKRLSIVLFLFLCFSVCATATVTINGYVTDSQSGERLIGASVYDTVSHKGTVTNNSGFYSLTLNAQSAQPVLNVSYVGYRSITTALPMLTRDTLINLSIRTNTQLEEVTVTGRRSVSSPESVQMSAIEVPVSQIKGIPALGGEVDVLKAIQLLPGVQSGSEGTSGLYVRGGGPDENLIILDGVPLYNVSHVMGFFSVFNADAIKNVTLYKGNFPAQYGGRLSGIIDVRQNDGNISGYHGNFTVGLLAAKANVEGPIPHKHEGTGSTTFNISARRTYFDAFTTPLIQILTESTDGQSTIAGAYFYDINAKVSHTFGNQNDKLSASFYMGDDALYMSSNYRSEDRVVKEKIGVDMNWGNILGAVNWEHRYTSQLFSNTQLSYTRYRYQVAQQMLHEEKDEVDLYFDQAMKYNSSLQDITLQSHYAWTTHPNHSLHFGAAYTFHMFRPEVSSLYLRTTEDGQEVSQQIDTTLTDGLLLGHEAALYVEDTYSPWDWLKLNIGLRGSLYAIDGKLYPSLEPRVGLRALITRDLAFKTSYSYTTQYVHMLSNSSVSLPTDLWVPVTKNILPMHSMIVAAGLSYDLLGYVELSVEGYYKRTTNLLEYKDGTSFLEGGGTWQDKVAMGDGWSYGVEFLLQRKIGRFTGWIGYTWSRTMRQFNRPGQEINFGKPFHAKYDREHDLSVTLQYQITPQIDIAATFIYGTGARGTLAMYSYYDPMYNGDLPYQQERNNFKMPDYHRLDVAANFHFPHKSTSAWCKDAEHILNVSIYNLYCHDNPYMIIPQGPELRQISIFPILPSISYTFKY